jgi:hypothetical protein
MSTLLEVVASALLSAKETYDVATLPQLTDRTEILTGMDIVESRSHYTTPPVEIFSTQTLTGASGTIDFTALPTLQGTRDATGMKLRYIRVQNHSTTTVFSIAAGGANGYVLNAVALKANKNEGWFLQGFASELANVDATHKTLDWTLTGGHTASLTLVFG